MTASAEPSIYDRLTAPFELHELEWRVLRSGVKEGKVWAIVIPYVSARAIHARLDQVLGPPNWRCEYHEWMAGKPGVLCGLGIRVPESGEWVTKWDGAEQSKESGGDDAPAVAVKGGFSGAFKRAAAVWGIGRYLYELDVLHAHVHDNGQYRGVAKAGREDRTGTRYRWDPPALYRPSRNGGAARAPREEAPTPAAAPAPVNAPLPPEERAFTIAGKTQKLGELSADELVALRVWCEKKNKPALIPDIDAVLAKLDSAQAGAKAADDGLPF